MCNPDICSAQCKVYLTSRIDVMSQHISAFDASFAVACIFCYKLKQCYVLSSIAQAVVSCPFLKCDKASLCLNLTKLWIPFTNNSNTLYMYIQSLLHLALTGIDLATTSKFHTPLWKILENLCEEYAFYVNYLTQPFFLWFLHPLWDLKPKWCTGGVLISNRMIKQAYPRVTPQLQIFSKSSTGYGLRIK